jgi:hypothetical protein
VGKVPTNIADESEAANSLVTSVRSQVQTEHNHLQNDFYERFQTVVPDFHFALSFG